MCYKLSLILLSIIIINGVISLENPCSDDKVFAFSSIFCEEAMHCSNDTSVQKLSQFRKCIAKKSEDMKKHMESSNKLGPDECIEDIHNNTCKWLKQITEQNTDYSQCFIEMGDISAIMKSCIESDDDEANSLELMAMVHCADESKVKCNTNEGTNVFKFMRKCLNENIDGVKDVTNSGDLHKCKEHFKEKCTKMVKEEKMANLYKCLLQKKQELDKFKPDKDCPGIH